jgi:uncharacterized protein with HEPN domain
MKDNDRLFHMLEMSRKVIFLIENKKKDDIYSDETLSMALIYALLIIGEAASAVSKEFRQKHPYIQWKQISGMRNRLIHGYFVTDLDIVWDTVSGYVPQLVNQLESLILTENE